ncbi:phosphocholine cytidylyltransferase family protein [Rhizobium rhizogenes]|uniref:phosphocholine cytidylyltransferase family protein n=1 Tax=Rhizobium rhizogenes TaxID=359 RepID=UPI001574B4A9|nr:phosphocholine cytidylyltransferase family protein [Rhizobium rhizogenes]NTI24873.1 phosphocholine cytidylyltransferase family protein [Rhizobium rhizogenes]QTG08593.1 phosphocholine cytidylyltransferase family protein [Rhizobium rhizogenes]
MSDIETPRVAIILAAGVGRRLTGWHGPKVLLQIDGMTLLERHISCLIQNNIDQIFITVGHCSEEIQAEIDRISPSCNMQLLYNPDFSRGSMVSLWRQQQNLVAGSSVLLMDGDVLYGPQMISRLVNAKSENVLLVDRNLEPGDEPVKICFREGTIVDFRKIPTHPFEWFGESVGFFRFSADMSRNLADRVAAHIRQGNQGYEYEEAIRDLILEYPSRFGAEDISDLPWTEIDFDADVEHARAVVLPLLNGQ